MEKEVEEKVRNEEQASIGREFQSGHLNHFHRKDNETLRLLLGFLDSGSAKKVEEAGVKQKRSLQQRSKTHSAEKKPKMVKLHLFGQMWVKTLKISKIEGFIDNFFKERHLLSLQSSFL